VRKDITILYVDDEPVNLAVFDINFNKKYTVITASSGKEGLSILRSNNSINIVISDMRMPEMDGLEFIRTAKKEFSNIIYFILTGFDITKEISEALTTKLIQRYFRKPFVSSEIEHAINTAID
jgi:response regulator RpfG family c-di-GMP phosphodiesterase